MNRLHGLFAICLLIPAFLFAQLDTGALPANDWVNFWPASNPVTISGGNWGYENDFYAHPFYPLFVMGPGHFIHPQDCNFYPYDPITNKWSKLYTAVRGPRGCLSSFCISAQDTAIMWWGGGEANHQLSQGGFTATYDSIAYNNTRGNRMWVYSFNSNRWHEMKGVANLPPPAFSRYPVYDPVHDVSINAKGSETWVYNYHTNNAVSYSNGGNVFNEYLYSNAVDEKRGLFYVVCGGSSGMRVFDPENTTWSLVPGSTIPTCVPNEGANSAGVNAMAYDRLHDIMLFINGYTTTTTWIFDCAARTWTQAAPATMPTALGHMAYNKPLNTFMMLGGTATGGSCSRGGGIAGMWAYRYNGANVEAGLAQAPAAAIDLTGGTVKLSWKPVAGSGITGYNVFRGTVNPYPKGFTKINGSPVTDTFYTDATAASGTRYSYKVCAVNANGDGLLSRHLYTCPGRPLGVAASVEESTVVKVSWLANPEPDLAGYNVYRANGPAIFSSLGSYTKLTASPVNALEYTDNVDLSNGVAKGYVITAVNAFGCESGPSGAATTFPNSPWWVSTINQSLPSVGLRTVLRWYPPERSKVRGVNLYRMNVTPINSPVSLITDSVTNWPVYSVGGITSSWEAMAGAYYVRAKNILGQEGFMSDEVGPTVTDWGTGMVPLFQRYDNKLYAGGVATESRPQSKAEKEIELKPNPFNPSVNLSFTLKSASQVRLSIFTTDGRLVRANAFKRTQGAHTERIDFSGLPSGVYLFQAEMEGKKHTARAICMR